MQKGKKPYIKLGRRLLEIRRSLNETLIEVSGAIELDVDIIESYEKGETRPSEDVLNMLISHFDIRDEEADELWDLAGYGDNSDMSADSSFDSHNPPVMSTVLVMPIENKIIYSDKVNVTVNQQGVVVSFMQESLTPGQAMPISRIGMSLDHAKKMIGIMQKTIEQFEDHKSVSGESSESRL